MKKGIIFALLIIFLMLIYTENASAFFFGGRINYTKTTEIASLEATGWICPVLGSTISITPIGSPLGTPSNYYIPSFISSKTGHPLFSNQLIIGRVFGKTMITCTYPSPPATTVVTLDTITLFGNSMR